MYWSGIDPSEGGMGVGMGMRGRGIAGWTVTRSPK
jgi:hypothetical protein